MYVDVGKEEVVGCTIGWVVEDGNDGAKFLNVCSTVGFNTIGDSGTEEVDEDHCICSFCILLACCKMSFIWLFNILILSPFSFISFLFYT